MQIKKAIPTFNVLVHSFVDTWQCLPGRFNLEVDGVLCEVLMTHGFTADAIHVAGTSIDNRYDLIIDYYSASEEIPSRNVYPAPRLRKIAQAGYLAECKTKLDSDDAKNFLLIPTWALNKGKGYRAMQPLPGNKRYIVRPNLGARGMGLLIVDTAVVKNPCFGLMPAAINEYLSNEGSSLPEGYNFIKGDTRYEGEEKNLWKNDGDSGGGLFIQEVLENIKCELRFIKGTKNVEAVLLRPTHSVNGMKVVSDQPDSIISPRTLATDENHQFYSKLGDELTDEIRAFIQDYIPSYSSIDVFITEDGKWGIFEFSNQFHLEDLPHEWVVNTHKRWLRDMLENRYEVEKPVKIPVVEETPVDFKQPVER